MTDDEWIESARGLATGARPHDGAEYDGVRAALVEVYRLLAAMPAGLSGSYRLIDEGDLVAAAAEAHRTLESGEWGWTLPDAPAGIVLSAAARVRALDRLLKETSAHHGPPLDLEAEYLCPVTDWFVVPRLTARVAQPGHGGRSWFQRRGTLEHRLLPKRLGSYTVQLHWLEDVTDPATASRFGAAMFEDFALDVEREGDPKSFHARGLTSPHAAAAIPQAMRAANQAGCACVAWPELTMRPDVELAMLRNALDDLAASDAPGGRPAFTLAGSWHVGEGDGRRNVAPVLDFMGGTILEHPKARAYADNDYGLEAICPDLTIPVLVTQAELVAFAICKDFCDFQENPYPTLNVDLIVVGSMDGDKTMDSHRAMAAIADAHGTSSFVVQQDMTTGRGETGWVLRPDQCGQPVELKALRRGSWSVE